MQGMYGDQNIGMRNEYYGLSMQSLPTENNIAPQQENTVEHNPVSSYNQTVSQSRIQL